MEICLERKDEVAGAERRRREKGQAARAVALVRAGAGVAA